MNARERFLSVMNFEPMDRTMLWASGYWSDAVRRWHREGLPHRIEVPDSVPGGSSIQGYVNIGRPYGLPTEDPRDDSQRVYACGEDIHNYFGLDQALVHVPLKHWLAPSFENVILEDHGDWMVHRDGNGIVMRDRKDRKSLPHWIGYPVNNRDDWEQIKAERLRPTLESRLPSNWDELLAEYRERDYPLCIGGCPAGFYGATRHLIGQDRILTTFSDDPELIRDIMDYLCDFWIAIYDQLLDQVDADACFIWEDMCYKNGPLISPAMFREFMLPNYKKLTACLRDHGMTAIMVDTDGDARQLIPLFAEGGVTIMYTCEVQSGMDVVELREAHPKMALIGGMDKKVLAKGREAIDAELDRKIPRMLESGGYIPLVDHQVPPDVSWENFVYYREKLNRMIKEGPGTLA